MMNSTGAKFKMSRIDQITNKQIVLIFCMQTVLCLIAATFATILQLNVVYKYSYLEFSVTDSLWNTSWPLMVLKTTGTWILLFT
jgi:hypothetical protein